jgi:outer membrane autotransporter protein
LKTHLSALPHAARTTRTALPARLLGSTALCALALLATWSIHPASAADWNINDSQSLTASANYDIVYVAYSGTGALTVYDGGSLSNIEGYIGYGASGTGAVTVTGVGSTWANSANLNVGYIGSGTLTVSEGGIVVNSIGYIGFTSDSTSAVTVTGAGSTWINSGELIVGRSGSGTLTIADGGTVTVGALNSGTNTYDGTLTIAYNSGSTGTLIIGAAAGQTAVAAGTLQAASVAFGAGAGTIVFNHTDTDYTFAAAISDYGTIEVHSGTTILSGNSSGFTGNTSIHGGNLTVTGTLGNTSSPGDMTIEGGSLTISGGGTVSNNYSHIGYSTGSTGAVTVTGTGSTWTTSNDLYVGFYGSGSLTISDGGTVSSYEGQIGYEIGSSGSATVTGAGSTWTTDQGIYVGNNGSGSLTISDGGMVSSYQGVIGYDSSGSGSATVTGAGSTWANSIGLVVGYYGSGTLSIADGGSVSSINAGIGYESDSTGAVTVTGAGSTWINSGDLYAGYEGSGTLTIADGGTVIIGALNSGTNTYDGTLTIAYEAGSTGTLIIGAAAGEAAVAAGTLQAASVVFGSGTGTIVFNHTETDYTFAAAISGDGTLDFDSGTTTLSADNSGFTGTTTVDDATLIINSVLGGTLQINGGGTLSGTGTIGTTTLASGGTISPGLAGTIGTLTVTGNLTFETGSTYAVDISSSASDQILVSGTADISGGTVSVTALDAETSYQTGQTYTILSAGTVTGSFAQTLTSSAFLDVSTATVDNTAVLTIALRTSGGSNAVFTPVARTTTQSAVASSLDTLEQSGTSLELYNELLMMSEDEAVETFQQMSGDVYASERSALASNALAVNTTVNSRIRSVFDGVAAPSVPVLGYAEDTGSSTDDAPFVAVGAHNGPAQAVAAERFAVWGSAFGSWGTMDGTDGASDTDTASGGVLTGIDKLFLDTVRLGAFAGYSHSTFDTSSSSGNSGNYHAGLYGGTELGHIALRSGLSYTWHDVSTSRRVSYLGQTLKGSYNASSFNVFGELGYRMDLGSNAFEPFAGLAHTQLETDGLTETGGSAALTVDSSTMDTTYTTLGLRASREFLVHGVSLTARGSAAWQHAFGDLDPLTTARFISGDSFSVSSTPIDENVAVLEAGFDIKPTANAILGFSYTGQIGENAVENGVNAKLRMKF